MAQPTKPTQPTQLMNCLPHSQERDSQAKQSNPVPIQSKRSIQPKIPEAPTSTYPDEHWMKEAIKEAKIAESKGEVPIGAVVVYGDEIIGRGHNLRESVLDGTAHAEMIAIREASIHLQAWRLLHCRLYVTLEPCPMCAGAIVQSRIDHVIYGATDPKAGCAGTLMNLLQEPRFNHTAQVTSHVLQTQCGELLTNFFRDLRNKRKQQQGK